MKKALAITFLLAPLLLATGCLFGRGIDKSSDYSTNLRDGDYTIAFSHYDALGYLKSLSIGVRDGLLTQVHYSETNKQGVNRAEIPTALHWEKCDFTYNQIIAQLYQEAIISQGKNIDTISGATKTCSDFSFMLSKLITASKNGEPSYQETEPLYETYTATNVPDPFNGSQEIMTVIFSKGQPVDFSVREVTNNAAYYSIGRSYSSLADLSKKNKSLDPVDAPSVERNILDRYNALLEQVRTQREKP